MMPIDQQTTPTELLVVIEPPTYFCRGCGKPLPEGTKANFHPDCRRSAKRERVARKRQREAQRETRRLRAQLRHLKCPGCGMSLAKLLQPNLGDSVEGPGDVAQRASEPVNCQERHLTPKVAAEPMPSIRRESPVY